MLNNRRKSSYLIYDCNEKYIWARSLQVFFLFWTNDNNYFGINNNKISLNTCL